MSSKRYPPELRERAVRMLLEHRSEYHSEHEALLQKSGGDKLIATFC